MSFNENSSVLLFLILKGNAPDNIMYKVIPLDHISTGKPLYPLFLLHNIISGAIYIGVPHLS